MFNRDISLNELLVSLESVLLLEYREGMKTEETLDAAVERLENTHAGDTYSVHKQYQTEHAFHSTMRDLVESILYGRHYLICVLCALIVVLKVS